MLRDALPSQTGSVFSAQRRGDGERVIVRALYGLDAALSERVREAARQAAKVRHPSIAAVRACFSDGEGVFIVSELATGEPLGRWTSLVGIPPLAQAVAIVVLACRALETAHRLGVAHEALAPSNLLVTGSADPGRRPTIKLLDLGLPGFVRQWPPALSSALYMAPEQLSALRLRSPALNATPVMNVYSCGALLYDLCTGGPPFAASSVDDLVEAHAAARLVPASRINPQVPSTLDTVLLRALSLDPEQRFASVSELIEALSELRLSTGTSGVQPLLRPSSPAQAAADAELPEHKITARTPFQERPTSKIDLPVHELIGRERAAHERSAAARSSAPPERASAPPPARTPGALRTPLPLEEDQLQHSALEADTMPPPARPLEGAVNLPPPPPAGVIPPPSPLPKIPAEASASRVPTSRPPAPRSIAPRAGSVHTSSPAATAPVDDPYQQPSGLRFDRVRRAQLAALLASVVFGCAFWYAVSRPRPAEHVRATSLEPRAPAASSPLPSRAAAAPREDTAASERAQAPEAPTAEEEPGAERADRDRRPEHERSRAHGARMRGVSVRASTQPQPSVRLVPAPVETSVSAASEPPPPPRLPPGAAALGSARASGSNASAGDDTPPAAPNAYAPLASGDGAPAHPGAASDSSAAASAALPLARADLEPAAPPPVPAPTPVAPAATSARAAASQQTTAARPPSPPKPRAPVSTSARVTFSALSVRGSLPSSQVRRGLERMRGQLQGCYRTAVRAAGRSGYGTLQAAFEIDEQGRARDPRVQGAHLPGLASCVAGALQHVASRRAPDTGTVHVSLQLEYTP